MVLWPLRRMRKSIVKVIDGVKNSQRNLLLAFLLIFLSQLLILYFLDGKTFVDSLYATVATVTTVGFGDVSPSSPLARLLFMPTMIAGVLMLPAVAVVIYEMQQQKVRGMTDSKQSDHIVVIGDSDEIIKAIIEEMRDTSEICLVTDIYEANPFDKKLHFVKGNPENKAILIQAGVERAANVIVAEKSDSTTLLVTALVRELNPKVNITATVISEEKANTLKTVGANQIINTDTVTGRLLASAVLEPAVVDLITEVTSTLQGHDIVEILATSDMAGKSFGEVSTELKGDRNVILLAINKDGSNQVNPSPDTKIENGDSLIFLD
ncbi:voltage-gated potassium channel [Methanohalophilus levihalophilus]|uniref:potassium channel family protein n=1 Tax=Methanohalophilus levihalophilus TaxID=1431282 RepID=UPI001AE35052|nr:NAD-binding protein [Methanohalophilus levihalophilus]MBP2029478.1 voltage-gated potassium channel [Methanohalophilus levihalophilus]